MECAQVLNIAAVATAQDQANPGRIHGATGCKLGRRKNTLTLVYALVETRRGMPGLYRIIISSLEF